MANRITLSFSRIIADLTGLLARVTHLGGYFFSTGRVVTAGALPVDCIVNSDWKGGLPITLLVIAERRCPVAYHP